MNCAALPEQLLESELFGYERGAFTGAMQSRAGQLKQAAGGTLFLDEVAEMATNVQERFLRVLQALLDDLGRSLGRPAAGIARDARRALLDYHWPGNVRELRNVLERAAILADGGLIVAEHFAFRPATPRAALAAPSPADPPDPARNAPPT